MKDKTKKLALIPIIIALGFIPMLVHSYTYDSGFERFDWFPDASAQQIDFFLWYKMAAIIAVALVMACVLVGTYFKDKRKMKEDRVWLLLLGYGVLVFVSALFSENRGFAFRGSYEVFESVWVVLGYVVMCYYTYRLLTSDESVQFVSKYAIIGIMIVTLIGFFQFFGYDFFRSTIGKKLITDTYMWESLESITFTFPTHTSYATLYNTNYLAFYYGLLIPVIAVLLIFTSDKRKKAVYFVLLALSTVTLVGSNSKSGLLALGITFVFACVILSKYIKKHIWIPFAAAAIFAGVVILYASRLGGLDALKNALLAAPDSGVQKEQLVSDIDTLEDEIVFYLPDDELHISYQPIENSQVHIDVYDKEGNEVSSQREEVSLILDGEQYAGCKITPLYIEEMVSLQVSIDGLDWYFTNQIDGTYYYYTAVGKFTKIPDVEKSHLFSDSIASGRGYLWNYILPKLKSCILIGKGSNTFAMNYPQDDYVQKKYRGTETLFDVKAHCFYIQQFLENGLLALLCFLGFYLYYLIQSVRLYRNRAIDSFTSMIGLGIMLGTFDYMIIAAANDSNVTTAPMFWVLLGSGMAINKMLIENDKKEEKRNGKKEKNIQRSIRKV